MSTVQKKLENDAMPAHIRRTLSRLQPSNTRGGLDYIYGAIIALGWLASVISVLLSLGVVLGIGQALNLSLKTLLDTSVSNVSVLVYLVFLGMFVAIPVAVGFFTFKNNNRVLEEDAASSLLYYLAALLVLILTGLVNITSLGTGTEYGLITAVVIGLLAFLYSLFE